MYPLTRSQIRSGVKAAAVASSLPALSTAATDDPNFQVMGAMWMLLRGEGNVDDYKTRKGLQLPSLEHVKGSWNYHKKGEPVDARDMLEHHYRLA